MTLKFNKLPAECQAVIDFFEFRNKRNLKTTAEMKEYVTQQLEMCKRMLDKNGTDDDVIDYYARLNNLEKFVSLYVSD